MFEVDRVAAIIRPKERMIQWLKQHPDAVADSISITDIRKDCTVLLIPQFDGPKQAREYIRQLAEGIFEAELTSWSIPKDKWPIDRGFDEFIQWYDIEFHSLIYDLYALEQENS